MSAAPFRKTLLSAVTAGTSQPVDVSQHEAVAVFLQSAGTTSGGTVLIEEAEWDPDTEEVYTGTWSEVQSIAASSFSGTASTMIHLPPEAYGFVRVRISSAITGGGTISSSQAASKACC